MTIKPGRQPSIPARKWETMQPVLYDLYIQQDLTLRATQRVMNERHGFTARYGYRLLVDKTANKLTASNATSANSPNGTGTKTLVLRKLEQPINEYKS